MLFFLDERRRMEGIPLHRLQSAPGCCTAGGLHRATALQKKQMLKQLQSQTLTLDAGTCLLTRGCALCFSFLFCFFFLGRGVGVDV